MTSSRGYLAGKLRNVVHSGVLLLGMSGLLAAIGYTLAGIWGIVASLAFWGLSALFSARVSPGLILRLYRARPLAPDEAPELYAVVAELARRAALAAVPRLHYLPSSAMNAVSLGSSVRPHIALTDGLLRQLGERELVGVLAHEVSHIMNRDLWVMGLADSISRLTSILSTAGLFVLAGSAIAAVFTRQPVPWLGGLLLLFAPVASELLQLALSRTREFDADLDAAKLTGDPVGLAAALELLEHSSRRAWPWVLWPMRRTPQPSLLRTHPDTRARALRLYALAETPPQRDERPSIAHTFAAPPEWRVVAAPPRRRWSGLWY